MLKEKENYPLLALEVLELQIISFWGNIAE